MDIPCQDCICLAVCKDTVPARNCGTPIKYSLMSHIEVTLRNKCSLLNNFIYFNDDYTGCGNNLHVVMEIGRAHV